MNIDLLKSAEAQFLQRYPGGFHHPEMLAIGKKHLFEKRKEQVQEWFSYDRFVETDGTVISESMIKIVSASSLVSVFEKPKFRDIIRALSVEEKQHLADALQAQLHGDAQEGFESMISLLQPLRIAKWPILTVIPTYFRPTHEAFVKPTTAKNIITYFGVETLKYSPKPSWEFYCGYRDLILEMKSHVDPSLSSSNAAFCGFLMMTMNE